MTDQTALINDTLALRIALTSVLEHDLLTVSQAPAFENGGKSTFAY